MTFHTSKLQKLVDEVTSGDNALPRVAVSVANRSGVIFEAAKGPRIFGDESSDETTCDSIFWLASQTKLITGLAGVQLIEKGAFTLDSEADQFIPELKDLPILKGFDDEGNEILTKRTKKVTMRDLFCHTAGTTFPGFSPDHERYRLKHGLEKIWEGPKAPRTMYTAMPFKAEPGTEYNYALSNDWLALAIEGASGMDFEAYCKKNIFEPLGITDMFFRRKAGSESKLVNLCMRKDGDKSFEPAPIGGVMEPECCSGGGGCFASPSAYIKVLRTLLNEGVSPDTGARILKPETLELLATPQIKDRIMREQLIKFLANDHGNIPKENPVDDMNRTITLAVYKTLKDVPGGRREGTLYGAGYANTFWTLDRKSDITWTIMTCIAPGGHPPTAQFCIDFEKAIYAMLASEQKQ